MPRPRPSCHPLAHPDPGSGGVEQPPLADLDTGYRVSLRRGSGALPVIETSRQRQIGLARNFVGALAKAQYDSRIRDSLAAGFGRTRPNVASLLGLENDQAGQDAGGLVLALGRPDAAGADSTAQGCCPNVWTDRQWPASCQVRPTPTDTSSGTRSG